MACCGRRTVNRPAQSAASKVRVPINYNSLTSVKSSSYSAPTQTSYNVSTQNTGDKVSCTKCGTEMKVKSVYVNANNEKKANVYCPQCQLVRIVSI